MLPKYVTRRFLLFLRELFRFHLNIILTLFIDPISIFNNLSNIQIIVQLLSYRYHCVCIQISPKYPLLPLDFSQIHPHCLILFKASYFSESLVLLLKNFLRYFLNFEELTRNFENWKRSLFDRIRLTLQIFNKCMW